MSQKEKIIKTAIKLFVKQGFENTPTAQITKEADVATGALFYHFKSKEVLINEAYMYVKKSMASMAFQGLSSKLSTEEQIKCVWMNLVKWSFKHKDESQFLEKFYGSSYIDNLTVEQMESYFEKGVEIYSKAVKEKVIRNIPIDLFSNLTFGLLHAFEKEFNKKKSLDKKLLEQSFDMYIGMLKG